MAAALASGPPPDPEHMVTTRAVSVHQRLDERALLVPSQVAEDQALAVKDRPTAAEVRAARESGARGRAF